MSKKSKKVWAKLIANPGSGNISGRGELLEQVTRSLKAGVKVDVAVAKPHEAALPIARRAVKEGYKIIIAMGGDDTVEAVIRGMRAARRGWASSRRAQRMTSPRVWASPRSASGLRLNCRWSLSQTRSGPGQS